MIEMLLEGILLLILGLLLCVFGIWIANREKHLGDFTVCDGTVTDVDAIQQTVTVSYTLDGREISAACPEALRAKCDTLPPIGLGVSVMVLPNQPETPCHIVYQRAMGRALGAERPYRNHNGNQAGRRCIWLGALMFVAGGYLLLRGLGYIS